jgi:putative membrane protein
MNGMKRRLGRWLATAAMTACAASAPSVWAVSLATTGPAQPLPDPLAAAVSLPVAENLTAGSASLVPLMAADLPAGPASSVDAGTETGGGDIGKPIDDISFLARATESAREELGAALDALAQLNDPELKRVAEELVKHHGETNARMAKIAEEKKWPLPAQERHAVPPAGAAIADFDANWTDDMILARERAAALYSAQAQGGEDQDLRRYARETLPIIQRHLAELRRLQK